MERLYQFGGGGGRFCKIDMIAAAAAAAASGVGVGFVGVPQSNRRPLVVHTSLLAGTTATCCAGGGMWAHRCSKKSRISATASLSAHHSIGSALGGMGPQS